VIAVGQQGHLSLVELGVLLQPRNPFFNRVAKPGTDLKTFAGYTVGHHGRLLKGEILMPLKIISKGLKYFQPVPILTRSLVKRQITMLRFEGNLLS